MASMRHGDMVSDVVSAATADAEVREPVVQDSWRRCLTHYHIDPQESHATRVLTNREYRQRVERHDFLVRSATPEMVNLRSQLGRAGYTVILTDPDGVVLQHYCDPGLKRDFQSAGLWQGADWSENTEGTNGIGTCITQRRPITVYKDDHFRAVHTSLSCSGAPIHDPQGDLLGVLDVSSVNRDDTRESQQSVLSSVVMSARMIENSAFLHAFRHARILRFHIRREFVGLLNEGLLALDRDDNIVGANALALNTLAIGHRDDIVGQNASHVVDLNGINRDGTGILADRLHGQLFHARVDAPARSNRQAVRARVSDHTEQFHALGTDRRVQTAAQRALRIMNANIPLLVLGETGAGKEVFARTLHAESNRADGEFVAVNCAAIPDTLIESELFGYAPGAFTGARREGLRGKIQQADGGTLFLDEIGDMPLHLQSKMLRVLENDELTPLGSDRPVKVRVQIVSASHRDIAQRVSQGQFREDLYYRLNGLSVTLPPLRERSDIEDLINGILAELRASVILCGDAAEALKANHWPGNIRQLKNVLSVALALCDGEQLQAGHLPDELQQPHEFQLAQHEGGDRSSNSLATAERNALEQALLTSNWNVTATAAQLGMSRNTLYRKMRRHGIRPQRG